MTDKKFTDEELISSLEVIATTCNCNECKIRNCKWGTCNCSQITANAALDLINRQKAEIERLKSELSNTRRKALLEASSKFAGHSNYHGDTILCKLICMAEGQEVGIAIPLDMSEMKANAYKEFAERLCEGKVSNDKTVIEAKVLLKEMVGEEE
nr:MAG TPA: hypothetical protein [Caudoviricetes sp.]